MQLHLEIITPERIAYTDTVDMVTVPGVMGTMGVLPKHIPLFAQLTHGELKIKKGDDNYYLSIGGGFIEVTKEKVIVLVTRAVNAKELNEKEILEAKQRAEEALKEKPTGEAFITAQMLLRQTLVDLKILRLRRRTVN